MAAKQGPVGLLHAPGSLHTEGPPCSFHDTPVLYLSPLLPVSTLLSLVLVEASHLGVAVAQ